MQPYIAIITLGLVCISTLGEWWNDRVGMSNAENSHFSRRLEEHTQIWGLNRIESRGIHDGGNADLISDPTVKSDILDIPHEQRGRSVKATPKTTVKPKTVKPTTTKPKQTVKATPVKPTSKAKATIKPTTKKPAPRPTAKKPEPIIKTKVTPKPIATTIKPKTVMPTTTRPKTTTSKPTPTTTNKPKTTTTPVKLTTVTITVTTLKPTTTTANPTSVSTSSMPPTISTVETTTPSMKVDFPEIKWANFDIPDFDAPEGNQTDAAKGHTAVTTGDKDAVAFASDSDNPGAASAGAEMADMEKEMAKMQAEMDSMMGR